MNRRMILLLSTVIFSTLLSLGMSSLSQAKPIELSFAAFGPPPPATSSAIGDAWLKAIEQRTNGRIKFNRFWGGTLLKGGNMYEGTVGGIANVGLGVFEYTPGRFPLWEAMALPLGFSSAVEANRVQWEVYKKFRPKEVSSAKVCSLFCTSPASMWSKVPIRTLEDMKGLQIRATGFTSKIVKALGGTPVGAPQNEVYEMLAKNIVVGSCASLNVLKSWKQADVTNYVTLKSVFYVSPFFLIMNWSTWNSLPEDIKKIIDDYSDEFNKIAGEIWDTHDEGGLKYAKEKGLEIITLSPEELSRWKKAVRPLLDDYVTRMEAQGLPGREFLNEILRLKDKYSK